ncbi:MAG: 1-acyl-sn-glycerol-3-phosphate acyltransferase [Acidobacteriota bacterium]
MLRHVRYAFVFLVLLSLHIFAKIFYRQQSVWIGEVPDEPWQPYRVVAILNHTSLYEFLLAGQVPLRFLWRMASHCTVPIAKVTIDRPLIGPLWRMVAANVVPVTRERDSTWKQVLDSSDDPDSMLIILPEGRMKRRGGLDKNGRPMNVRGGIADLVRGADGQMLIAYNQGLHHIQIPGEHWPRFFQPVRLRFESLDISEYRRQMVADLDLDDEKDALTFKRRIMDDLDARRDRYCTSDLGGTDEPEAWSYVRGVVTPKGGTRYREGDDVIA